MARIAAILIDRQRDDHFRSAVPRLLHPCAGQALWRWPLEAVQAAGASKVLWLGDSRSLAALKSEPLVTVTKTFEEALRKAGPVSGYLIAYADAPVLHPEDLKALIKAPGPTGSIRCSDLGDEQAEPAFVYVPASARKALKGPLGKGLLPQGVSAELSAVDAEPFESSLRVIDRCDLSDAEGYLRESIIQQHQMAGVTFVDPASCFVDATVAIGQDTVVQPHTFLTGSTVVGKGCQIGPFTRAHDSLLDDGCQVEQSVLDSAVVRKGAQVGPWSRLRPGSDIGVNAHTGSFVELKNSRLGKGAKAGHLSYLGDAQVGDGANIGAGTITANYDGKAKHATKIGKRAFIGSGTVLVAPVSIGDKAVTGAGSVVLKGRNVAKGTTVAGVPARVIRAKRA